MRVYNGKVTVHVGGESFEGNAFVDFTVEQIDQDTRAALREMLARVNEPAAIPDFLFISAHWFDVHNKGMKRRRRLAHLERKRRRKRSGR